MTQLKEYPVRVFWSEDDSGFIAEAIDLPGCSAFGGTQAEALSELPDAMKAWMEAARSVNNVIPAPSRVDEPEEYSGRIGLRLPKSLHAKLAKIAAMETQSLNSQIVTALVEFQATWWAAKSVSTPVVTNLSFAALRDRYLVLNTAFSDRHAWSDMLLTTGMVPAHHAAFPTLHETLDEQLHQPIAVAFHG